jgi:hypothetical protein
VKHLLSVLILLLCGGAVCAQEQCFKPSPLDELSKLVLSAEEANLADSTIITSYDKFEDRTRYSTTSVIIRSSYSEELRISGFISHKGRGVGMPIEFIGLVFFSASTDWKYLKDSDLNAIVDGQRVPIGPVSRNDSELPRASDVYSDTRLRETLMFRVPYLKLKRISNAKIVEMRLGSTEFDLEDSFLLSLRSLLAKVKPIAPIKNQRAPARKRIKS